MTGNSPESSTIEATGIAGYTEITQDWTAFDGVGSDDINVLYLTNGSSQEQLFTGLTGSASEEVLDYTQGNATGNLTSIELVDGNGTTATVEGTNVSNATVTDTGGGFAIGSADDGISLNNDTQATITGTGDGIQLASGAAAEINGDSDTIDGTGGAITMGASNINSTIDDASDLTFTDASGVTGGNVELDASNLDVKVDTVGGLGFTDAAGVTGGAITMGASNIGVVDDASGTTVAEASGITGTGLYYEDNTNTFDGSASGIYVSDDIEATINGSDDTISLNSVKPPASRAAATRSTAARTTPWRCPTRTAISTQ